MTEGAIPGEQEQTQANSGDHTLSKLWGKLFGFNEAGLLLAVIAFGLVIAMVKPAFLSGENVLNVARSSAFTFIVACGLTFCFVGGGLDLSVGSIYGAASIFTGTALRLGVPIPQSILIGMVAGCAFGLINGLIITRFNIPALIVTLGMLYVARGVAIVITTGEVIIAPGDFSLIGKGSVAGIPNPIILAAVIGIISHFVLENTKFGYAVHGLGGNREAARVCGINVKRAQVWLYVITGLASAFSGILMGSRLAWIGPTAGVGLEMTAISAVFIGGTSLYGGVGTIFGSLLGSIFLGMIANGVIFLGVDVYWQNIVIGLVIVVAVGIDQYRRKAMWRSH
jgi:ribose/xylose/arabinose/galactoside ABC-type transport system permease subunit